MTISPLMPVYPRCDVRPVRGEGCYLYGERGEQYLDFASGIAVNALGHAHPEITKALTEQAATLMHVSNLYGTPLGEKFAQHIVDTTFADTVFFTNSGAEAVECAMKTARAYHQLPGEGEDAHLGRFEIITFNNAFHGRTMATISASSQEKMHHGFLPLLPGFSYVPFGDLAGAEAAIDSSTAAFMIEPIQGEGGVRPADIAFLQGLRKLADEHGKLLILDEVQCGVGRTGTLFAYEQYGIVPDIVATAKGIGNGFPLGACLATEKAARGMTFGTHGSTYGGNPLAMAVGNAVWDIIADEDFLDGVKAKGERLRGALEQFIGNYPDLFVDVRGMGLMLGLKMTDKAVSRDFVAHMRDNHGLLTVAAGDNVVRILPPLIIEENHINEAIAKLSAAAESFTPAEA